MTPRSARLAPATLACIGLALLAGCATPAPTSASLTYETVPAGATLYEQGKPIGVAPVTRRYEAPAPGADITTPDVTAVWPSGAKTMYYTVLKPGDDRVASLARPKSAPGEAVDVANAAKVTEEQARDAERLKQRQLADQKRASARCQAQMSGAAKGAIDDC